MVSLLLITLLGTQFYYKYSCFFVIFRVAVVAIVLVVIVLTAVVIGARVNQYRGIVGLVFFIVLLFITSDNPSKVGPPNPHVSCQLVVTLNMYM